MVLGKVVAGPFSSSEESCSFQGIAIDVYHRGHSRLPTIVGSLVSLPRRRSLEIGYYARVWLQDPLGIGLLLQSRPELPVEEDDLDAHFEISATNSRLARRRLEGLPAAALIRLANNYHVIEMRDDSVDFGPLFRTAEEIAADLAILILALGSLGRDSSDDDLVDPDLGPNAPFCFFCGATVRQGAAVCPRCGERLDEDQDDDDA
jgi:hypothetical protein